MTTLPSRRAMSRRWRNCIAAILLVIVSSAANTFAQVPHVSLHGAHETFLSPDVAIAWAVLKAPSATDRDHAVVWLRIVNANKKFTHMSIDGVDPFSKKRERVQPGMLLQAEARVQSDRDTFSELPSRELHFYRSEADLRAEKPALTVYYFGVPDQTPEFSTRAAMDTYLAAAKLVAPQGHAPRTQ